ncbi:MAG: peptidoglycan editing factor PgeF [Cyanobium sp. Prado107]|jgi:YfiH family protein|nr:peptidoglycan editing factor PgeF [Cyanobium sp. Prado107]
MAEAVDPPFDRPDVGFNDLAGWSWVGCYGGYYLQAELLEGFEHGFFTRQWQGREPEVLAGYLSAGVSIHRPRQVHSAVVLPASRARRDPWPESDGLCSDAGGQSLWVCGADCTPALLADPVRGAVAACHAGWRGVAGRILATAVTMLEAGGSRSSDLLVALGPAVSGSLYQVERSVSEQVAASLDVGSAAGLSALREAGALLDDPHPGRDRLDIRAAARLQLRGLGVPDTQISVCPLCTVSEPDLFHSWRRDQVKAVQWSGIVSQA